ncbi:ankyrin repeat-containing domain protein [Stachybotrys elegans]|uniref:Ankyrin repeat-containing domain protein n=1 Tax=Stachybotrys elegans TaxID=80388 RepID=A0A8K0SYL1_9HYPO|nr:ankyrin repeat-containing domain protein [Stachybotrys elegans]
MVKLGTQDRDLIKQAVPGRANGLFLYAKLAMDAFLEEGANVKHVLKALPMDLNIMYADLLREHARRSQVPDDIQLLILSFVTHASRPLRLLEISEIINFMAESRTKETGDLKGTKNMVRTACGPLLEILPDETISIVHHSLTEFINGSTRQERSQDEFPRLDAHTTHNRLAIACVSYLLSGVLDLVKLPAPDDYEVDSDYDISYYVEPAVNRDLPLKYPFLGYCLQNWHVHARKADGSGPLSEELSTAIDRLLTVKNLEALETLGKSTSAVRMPLCVAARRGLSQYVEKLIRTDGADVNGLDDNGESPLLHASRTGHANVVRILLDNGADPNPPSMRDDTRPLHAAAFGDFPEVVELLLAAGVDPMTQKTRSDPGLVCGDPYRFRGDPALMYAARFQHSSALKAFLPYLKDAETVSHALLWAAEFEGSSGSAGVDVLLTHPLVDVNARCRMATPLYVAAANHSLKSAISLMKAGADPNILSSTPTNIFSDSSKWESRDLEARTPLHALCTGRRRFGMPNGSESDETQFEKDLLECVSLMIGACKDVNQRDYQGKTALHHAAGISPALVGALLSAGADANARTSDGDTALHICTDIAIIRTLVEKGNADINCRRLSDGRTPLMALLWKHVLTHDLLRQLIDLGADLTLCDNSGRGILHNLMSYGRRADTAAMVDTLLEMGLSPNAQDEELNTPLHLLMQGNHDEELAMRLVAAGADVNARNKKGRTPIFAFLSWPWEAKKMPSLQNLLKVGFRIDVVDHQGKNVLYACVHRTKGGSLFKSLTDELVKHGMDANPTDYLGNTLLHAIIIHNAVNPIYDHDYTIPQQLGIDPDQVNYDGQSALHFLLVSRHQSKTTAWSMFQDLDVRDHQGIRPLHIAAKASERSVHYLLEKGVHLTAPTSDGMTPLHIAARFGNQNIVGRLLEAIRASHGEDGLRAHLNSIHATGGPTILQTACRSGVSKIVRLLLEAGADPNFSGDGKTTALQWCLQFEEEEALWSDAEAARSANRQLIAKNPSRGLHQKDTARDIFKDDVNDSFRPAVTSLEDVLDLLHAHGADMISAKDDNGRTNLERAIASCRSCDDYTMECLLRLHRRLEHGPDNADDNQISTSEQVLAQSNITSYAESLYRSGRVPWISVAAVLRRAASTQAFRATKPWEACKSAEDQASCITAILDDLLGRRDWASIEFLLQHGPKLHEIQGGYKILAKLVQYGHVHLLRGTNIRESIRQLQIVQREIVENNLQLPNSEEMDESSERPEMDIHIMVDLCRSSQGNMDMIRYLVEELEFSVNESIWELQGSDSEGYSPILTTIGCVAAGEEWWQLAECLPYMISHGADIEARDSDGYTPLIQVLREGKHPVKAAKLLIEAGANVNATDYRDRTCLSMVQDHPELRELLLSHGAVGLNEALANAISSLDLSAVEHLLALGAGTKLIKVSEEWEDPKPWDSGKEGHLPPIFFIALHHAFRYSARDKTTFQGLYFPLMRALLEHGADPLARLIKRSKSGETEETTVLHQILQHGGIVQPLLQLPDLDVEHEDSQGRTPLLSACGADKPDVPCAEMHYSSKKYHTNPISLAKDDGDTRTGPTAIELLLEMGASVRARDHQQRNALHHLLAVPSFAGYKSMKLLLSRAPELLHETDVNGETPFHYALRRVPFIIRNESQVLYGLDIKAVELLLDAGANVARPDMHGNSALHQVAKWLAYVGWDSADTHQSRNLFARLVSLGLPINATNQAGETPAFSFTLHEARTLRSIGSKKEWDHAQRQTKAFECLVAAGADLFAKTPQGETLLHAVASGDRKRTRSRHYDSEQDVANECTLIQFRWLLEKGLDPLDEDSTGKICLDVATLKGHGEILKLFERSAGDV